MLDSSIQGNLRWRILGNWAPRNLSKGSVVPDWSLGSICWVLSALKPPSKENVLEVYWIFKICVSPHLNLQPSHLHFFVHNISIFSNFHCPISCAPAFWLWSWLCYLYPSNHFHWGLLWQSNWCREDCVHLLVLNWYRDRVFLSTRCQLMWARGIDPWDTNTFSMSSRGLDLSHFVSSKSQCCSFSKQKDAVLIVLRIGEGWQLGMAWRILNY